MKPEVPDLTPSLEALRVEWGLNHAQFCERIGLNKSQWAAARQGKVGIGALATHRILRRVPALVPLVYPEYAAERAA